MIDSPKFKETKFKFISKEAKHMIMKMLRPPTNERFSARECLEHPWMKKFYSAPDISDSIVKCCLDECFNYNVYKLIFSPLQSFRKLHGHSLSMCWLALMKNKIFLKYLIVWIKGFMES